MPNIQGYSSPRYQEHDILITTLVSEFNKNKSLFIGSTVSQANNIPDLTEIFVKSWIIQETGGNDPRSLSAWKIDPAQVNVPGDWSAFKQSTGLTAPTQRNEGTAQQNLKAAIIWLTRKGFGKSGQPPKNRETATFDSWQKALERYNGRSISTSNNLAYNINYAQRIIDRAHNPTKHYIIQLPKP